MIDEILINVSRNQTRIALLGAKVLQELLIENHTDVSMIGNIYYGKIERVLPSMQAAFIDIGLGRTAFLSINDMHIKAEQIAKNTDISTLLYAGQKLAVQVIKDPLGDKGARLTTQFSLSSHYMVYRPQLGKIGVSARIQDEQVRKSFLTWIKRERSEHQIDGGFIVRTAAENCSEQRLCADMLRLHKLWQLTCEKRKNAKLGDILYQNLALTQQVLRDMDAAVVKRIVIDQKDAAKVLLDFAASFVPDVEQAINFYEGRRPLFEEHGIEDEINIALQRRVDLNAGAYVVFDQTEAMTTVDVNSGAFVGKKRSDHIAYEINRAAAKEIARQIRLRNLGGMIIIDFIDMSDKAHRLELNRVLDQALSQDSVKTMRYELKQLGLAAITRTRTRESLEQTLCEECAHCHGVGYQRSVATILNDLFRTISGTVKSDEKKELLVVVAQFIADQLRGDAASWVKDVEMELGVTMTIRIEEHYAIDQFDVIFL